MYYKTGSDFKNDFSVQMLLSVLFILFCILSFTCVSWFFCVLSISQTVLFIQTCQRESRWEIACCYNLAYLHFFNVNQYALYLFQKKLEDLQKGYSVCFLCITTSNDFQAHRFIAFVIIYLALIKKSCFSL